MLSCCQDKPILSIGAKLTQKGALTLICVIVLEGTSKASSRVCGQDSLLDDLVSLSAATLLRSWANGMVARLVGSPQE